jgi:hypothetical protein
VDYQINQGSAAFTRTDLMVVIVVVSAILFFGTVLVPIGRSHLRLRIDRLNSSCMNNLKQVGIASQIWANDNRGKFPASQSIANGGWSDLLANGDQGPNCWTNYAIMANDLGRNSRVLACPSDPRWARAWTSTKSSQDESSPGAKPFLCDNSTISYFVGVSATPSHPNTLLSGDRNLGAAASEPENDYGFSAADGNGNDVAVQTNTQTGGLAWSMKMHSA